MAITPNEGNNSEATPSASVIEMNRINECGLTNGETLQLRMLAQALAMYNKHGMHLTHPSHINRCFQFWMLKAGENMTGRRPNWKTKEKLLHKHFGFALAE